MKACSNKRGGTWPNYFAEKRRHLFKLKYYKDEISTERI